MRCNRDERTDVPVIIPSARYTGFPFVAGTENIHAKSPTPTVPLPSQVNALPHILTPVPLSTTKVLFAILALKYSC